MLDVPTKYIYVRLQKLVKSALLIFNKHRADEVSMTIEHFRLGQLVTTIALVMTTTFFKMYVLFIHKKPINWKYPHYDGVKGFKLHKNNKKNLFYNINSNLREIPLEFALWSSNGL